MDEFDDSQAVTPNRPMQFAWGYAAPLVLETAIEIGLFDSLASGPKSAKELAPITHSSLRGVTAIANVLVGLNLLRKDQKNA